MQYVVQHYGEAIGDYVTLTEPKQNLADAVDSARRISIPWAGQGRKSDRTPETYRIVEMTKNGRHLAYYNVKGELIETVVKKKAAAAPKVAVAA